MEISSYLVNPRSSTNAHALHTIRRNLTSAALKLDSRAKSFHVGISHKKGWLNGPEQPQEYPLEVDLLDRDRISLLSYFHDFEPQVYEKVASRLKMLVEQYLDDQNYAVGVVTSSIDIRTDSSLLPRRWLQKIIPRIRGVSVVLGGPSTLLEGPLSVEDTLERGESQYRIPLQPRRMRANPLQWELACDISDTVKEIRFETDVYPEFSHYTKTYNAIQDSLLELLTDLYNRGTVVANKNPSLVWGFVQSDFEGLYSLGWNNEKVTNPSGGPTPFAEKICRDTNSANPESQGSLLPYYCPDNDHSRHFLSRALLQLGYGAPVFQKDRVFLFTTSQKEAFALASVVQTFSAGAGGIYGGNVSVNAMKRVNPQRPEVFETAEPSQKSVYMALDSNNIYVYSIAQS